MVDARALMGRLGSRIGLGRPADPRPFAITVSEGEETLYADRFAPGLVTVGGLDSDADVIVADLAPALALSLDLAEGEGGAAVTLTALGDEVIVGERAFEAGEQAVLGPDETILLGGYRFAVSRPAPPKRLDPKPLLLGAGSLAAALLALMIGQGGGVAAPPAPHAGLRASLADGPQLTGLPAPSAETDLRLRLIAGNLVPPLRVMREGGYLVVAGDVEGEERVRAHEIVAAFRARSGLPVEMRLPPDRDSGIAAIAVKPEPFVTAKDGRRYTPGQRLPDGAVLESIDETTYVLDRGGVKERIVYAR